MKSTLLPPCPFSGSTNVQIVYEGPIRSGGANSGFEDGFRVLECPDTGLVWLDPFPSNLTDYYQSNEYWVDHHAGNANLENLQKKLDHEQLLWLEKLGPTLFRNQCVADFGCGPGLFFDVIGGLASRCIGVDLTLEYKSHLECKGHEFLQYGSELGEEWADVVVSFDTLEHVPQPWVFLKEISKVLKPGGTVCIGVPNYHDFLKELVPDYLKFFYHKSHLWYFTSDSLCRLLANAGFKNKVRKCLHKYDLNNMLCWARDKKGVGKHGSGVFDIHTESSFIQNMEREMIGSHILIVAQK